MPSVVELLLKEFDTEMTGTRRALEHAPEGKYHWKPHPKSMELGYLASLVATMPGWLASMVNEPKLDLAAGQKPDPWNTRAELLKDEPGHPRAGEEYYKIQVGPLERLPRPIQADKWRRITFLYTTGEYLLGARTIDDLVIQSEERQLLWQALRERANQSQAATSELPDAELDPDLLAALLGLASTDPGKRG